MGQERQVRQCPTLRHPPRPRSPTVAKVRQIARVERDELMERYPIWAGFAPKQRVASKVGTRRLILSARKRRQLGGKLGGPQREDRHRHPVKDNGRVGRGEVRNKV